MSLLGWLLITLGLFASTTAPALDVPAAQRESRGRYIAAVAGCHDCHTPGYTMNGGQAPQEVWFTGDTLGWSGPWGTTYPANLRLRVADMSEREWIAYARTLKTRPPMPYWALNTMEDGDLSALWIMFKSLGKAGAPAPAALPPGVEAKGPVVRFPAPPPQAATVNATGSGR